MKTILVAALVYAFALWAGIPGPFAQSFAVVTFTYELLGALVKWAYEWNARKLKELTKS